jgi:hypothetical protein
LWTRELLKLVLLQLEVVVEVVEEFLSIHLLLVVLVVEEFLLLLHHREAVRGFHATSVLNGRLSENNPS